MSSYELIKLAFAIAAVILGVGMLIKPERFLKKGSEGSEAEISKYRKVGTFVTVVGILAVLLNIVLIVKY
ncbi:MAG: hypothetical protein K6F71_08990 [Ruminococcus sp.]|uniref:hypothetical protein n=1 Tax=Ruminococcus sp. TaxID=41978 RepID=UPI0025EE2B92|nr:hypothetical protein [Ruminococcus sp.]MCR5540932.1 hypothetical protein [Ruminococcus sp.]